MDNKVSIGEIYVLPSLAYALCVLILMVAAFVNHFPLTHFGDTAVYIMYGFTKTHPAGTHSFFYGLWIYFTSLNISLWFVILFQASLLAFCIIEFTFNFTLLKYSTSIYVSLIIIILLGYFTTLLKHTGVIMPDIFTSIGFCVTAIFLLGKKINLGKKIFISLVLLLTVTIHTSHILTFLSIAVVFSISLFIFFRKESIIFPKKIFIYFSIVSLAYIVIPLVHNAYTGEFYLSKSSQTFLIGRLSETGILEKYLNEKCPSTNLSLCQYNGTFTDTWSFLWDMEKSPLYKNGDLYSAWDNKREEYSEIVNDILTTPEYLFLFIVEGIKSTFQQFFTTYFPSDNSRVERIANEIWLHLPDDLNDYNLCLQSKGWFFGEFDEKNIERTYKSVYLSCLILAIIVFFNFKLNFLSPEKKVLLVLFFIFVFSNAAVCAFFSAASARYQDRVQWLFPFIVIIILIDPLINISKNFNFFKNVIN